MNRGSWAVLALSGSMIVAACIQDVVPGTPTNPPGPGGATAGPSGNPTGLAGAFVAFVKDNDLWVVTADGARPIQLTNDGSAGPYTNPTVAPDGTIYVLRNEEELHHIDLAGRVIGAPVALGVLENGAEGLTVATDGAHLAFVTTGWGTIIDPRFGTPTGSYIYGGTDLIGPDGTSLPGAALGSLIYPSWLDPSTLVLTDGVSVHVDTLTSDPSVWLTVSLTEGCVIPSDCPAGHEPLANFTRPVVSRTGTLIAYEYQPYFGTAGRRMATIDAAPPATPTLRCVIEGQEDYSDPGSFSSDGSLFAFDDTRFDGDTLETIVGQGVYVMTVDLDAPDCGLSSARLIAPGGQQPEWGPAGP